MQPGASNPQLARVLQAFFAYAALAIAVIGAIGSIFVIVVALTSLNWPFVVLGCIGILLSSLRLYTHRYIRRLRKEEQRGAWTGLRPR
jgi:hypothetical protein